MEQSPYWDANRFSASQGIPPHFMELEGSLPHSQVRRNLSLSWASSIQPILPHPTSWRSVLVLSSHLRLGLPSGLSPSGFPTKTLHIPRIYMASCPTRLRSPRFSWRCLQIVGLWSHILLWLWFCAPLKGIHVRGVMPVCPCAVYHTRNDYEFSPTSVIKSTWQTAILTKLCFMSFQRILPWMWCSTNFLGTIRNICLTKRKVWG